MQLARQSFPLRSATYCMLSVVRKDPLVPQVPRDRPVLRGLLVPQVQRVALEQQVLVGQMVSMERPVQ